MKGICAVILAAGEGTRMRSSLSKVLHSLAGKPVVSYVAETVGKAGIRDAIVVGGKDREMLARVLPENFKVVFQKKRLGTGHAVMMCRPKLGNFKGDIFVTAGDAPLLRPDTVRAFIQWHREDDAAASILTASFENPYGYGRILRNGAGDVTAIREEIEAGPEERKVKEVNSSIYLFKGPELFEALGKIKPSPKKKEYFLTDVIAVLVARGLKVKAYSLASPKEIMGINTRADLADATREVWKTNIASQMERGVTVMSPENTYIEADVKIGEDTTVYPFSYIESGVTIGKNCRIGPFCKIRSGSRISDEAQVGSFVEVNRSEIGKKTLVKHLAYLGDARLGDRVNVGAGTITANYDGKAKNRTRVGDGAFLGCDTILIAPVSIGAGARTGAGSVVLKGKNVPAGVTVAGIPARKIMKKKR